MLSPEMLKDLSVSLGQREWSKDAFNCKKCPGEGCPAYWKFKMALARENDPGTVEIAPFEGCSFQLNLLLEIDSLVGNAKVNEKLIDSTSNFSRRLDSLEKNQFLMSKLSLANFNFLQERRVERNVLDKSGQIADFVEADVVDAEVVGREE